MEHSVCETPKMGLALLGPGRLPGGGERGRVLLEGGARRRGWAGSGDYSSSVEFCWAAGSSLPLPSLFKALVLAAEQGPRVTRMESATCLAKDSCRGALSPRCLSLPSHIAGLDPLTFSLWR
uniref:Uncharacterized protein n=1 Tax=Myotis myotis TaxID=51298 RepID=A0A7J7UD17_MYOMY|nr:hypothetical protein mMyoMyo1_008803 [Myotis myotis]